MKHTFSPFLSMVIGIVLLAVLAAAIGLAVHTRAAQSGENAGQTRYLKLGHGLPTDHPVHLAMQRFAERLKELSGGKLQIRIYPSGMIGSEAECLKQVQNNQIDISKTSTAVLESSVPELTALSLPYVFRDSAHFWKVLDGPLGKQIGNTFPGMRALTYYDAGERSFYTTKKPVRSVADLKGLKIRTQQSRSAMDMVTLLGGAPTPIPWGELYTALSQGTVDGAENNLPSFDTGRHSEVCKYFIFSRHSRVPDVLVISRATWDSLTPQEQKWITEAAHESSLYQRDLWRKAEQQARGKAEKQGVRFLNVDDAEFAARLKPMLDSQPAETMELIRKIREVK